MGKKPDNAKHPPVMSNQRTAPAQETGLVDLSWVSEDRWPSSKGGDWDWEMKMHMPYDGREFPSGINDLRSVAKMVNVAISDPPKFDPSKYEGAGAAFCGGGVYNRPLMTMSPLRRCSLKLRMSRIVLVNHFYGAYAR